MELQRRFGGHVRTLRTARNFTQEELAVKSGLSVDSIRRIERGAFSPSLDTIEKVANGLHVSLATLFHTFEEGSGLMVREVCDMVERMPPTRSRAASRVIRTLLDGEGDDV